MNKRNEGGSQLIVAGSDSAECLHFIEETFHQVPLLIGVVVAKPRFGTVLLGGIVYVAPQEVMYCRISREPYALSPRMLLPKIDTSFSKGIAAVAS